MKAPPALKDLVDAKSWYITMKFDGSATREDAKKVFEYTMVEKLGLPRTQQNLDDEILPKNDYSQSPAPSSAPQLAAPPSASDADVVDIDDDGNVKNDLVASNPLSVAPVSKYYAVEFKIFEVPVGMKPKYIGGPSGKIGYKSKKCWAPPHQLGMYH